MVWFAIFRWKLTSLGAMSQKMWAGYKKYTQATFGTVRSTVVCRFISEKPQNEAFGQQILYSII